MFSKTDMNKGLRPDWMGLLSQCKGACANGEGSDALFAQAWVHFDNKRWQTGLNHDYNMTFLISLHE